MLRQRAQILQEECAPRQAVIVTAEIPDTYIVRLCQERNRPDICETYSPHVTAVLRLLTCDASRIQASET